MSLYLSHSLSLSLFLSLSLSLSLPLHHHKFDVLPYYALKKYLLVVAKIEGISNAKCDHAMFKATRLLYQKQFENPKVEDQEGKLASNPNDILDIVSSHFRNKFEDETAEEITPFEGEPKPLKNPITPKEVRKSFNSLSNYNKVTEEDQIHAELLRYGTPLLDQTIADIFKATFF